MRCVVVCVLVLFLKGGYTQSDNIFYGSCSHGMIQFGPYCYGYVNTPETWADAQATCKATTGSKVAEPRSFQENIFLQGLVSHYGQHTIWLGADDQFTEGTFYWASDGAPLTGYTDWAPGKPDDYMNAEDCLTFSLSFHKWDDRPCSQKNNFICQSNATAATAVVG